jgi:hypothetical protein
MCGLTSVGSKEKSSDVSWEHGKEALISTIDQAFLDKLIDYKDLCSMV